MIDLSRETVVDLFQIPDSSSRQSPIDAQLAHHARAADPAGMPSRENKHATAVQLARLTSGHTFVTALGRRY